ncbi:MAG: substrate-binding domain-containing protein [Taibaiella sp.]|nr:substrate-binding domain-containing protein [Taibaiella sp.]
MNRINGIWLLAFIMLSLASCTDDTHHPADTLSTGTIEIAADETYKPVIEQQLKVFDSSLPDAHVHIRYEAEADCFRDFFDGKVHLLLVTRQLTAAEKQLCEQKQIAPSSESLAKDAIAVIVNNASPDSLLGMNELKGILSNTYKKKYTVVFDNQGSSTVRYVLDSLMGGQKPSGNVFAAKSNEEVLEYVAKNPDAIGFTGMSNVSDPAADSNNTGAFIRTVKVVSIRNDSAQQFYQPYQAYIALKVYPLTRNLYYINRDSYLGLSRGFANFLVSPRGQLVFAHAQLFPLKMSIIIRDASINNQ